MKYSFAAQILVINHSIYLLKINPVLKVVWQPNVYTYGDFQVFFHFFGCDKLNISVFIIVNLNGFLGK